MHSQSNSEKLSPEHSKRFANAYLYFKKGKVNFMKQSNQFLGAEPIGKLMKKYAVPCIIFSFPCMDKKRKSEKKKY